MRERWNRFIYNLPWWWILIPIGVVLVPLLLLIVSDFEKSSQSTSSEWLHNSETLTIEGYQFTMDETEPDGCTSVQHTKNLSETDIFWVICDGLESPIYFQCSIACIVRAPYEMEIKK